MSFRIRKIYKVFKYFNIMSRLIIILLLLIISISGCGVSVPIDKTPVSKNLPDDFSINIYYDATSSGGDKIQKATLTFEDGKLINGKREYHGNIPKYLECNADPNSLYWKAIDGSACEITWGPEFPLSKLELEKEIIGWKEKSEDNCINGEICYQLIS